MARLSKAEIAFLGAHGISLSRTFNATGMTKTEYHDEMKALELWVAYGVSPCREAGHRLRTRAGHCLQCRPANISFLARHDEPGEVYVAHSSSTLYTKVGTARDSEVRVKSLNTHKYGQIGDWALAYFHPCTYAGKVEFLVHSELRAHHFPRPNATGANSIECQELFGCKPEDAIRALILVLSRYSA